MDEKVCGHGFRDEVGLMPGFGGAKAAWTRWHEPY